MSLPSPDLSRGHSCRGVFGLPAGESNSSGPAKPQIYSPNDQPEKNPAMDQQKCRADGVQEKLEIVGVEDESGNPISALTILSLLERVAGIIDNVQSGQQRMEERQLELESSIKAIQGDVLKLAKDHTDTSGVVERLLQKTRKVSANVKEVRTRVEKQNVRVKKVESTQDELLTRNKFRVVIYQVRRCDCLWPSAFHRGRESQNLTSSSKSWSMINFRRIISCLFDLKSNFFLYRHKFRSQGKITLKKDQPYFALGDFLHNKS